MKKLNSVTTDGMPSMIENKKGFIQRLISDSECNKMLINLSLHHSSKCVVLQVKFKSRSYNDTSDRNSKLYSSQFIG